MNDVAFWFIMIAMIYLFYGLIINEDHALYAIIFLFIMAFVGSQH